LADLWNRDFYGAIATDLFLHFPVFGTGVGSFNTLVIDYAKIYNHVGSIAPDNAQNWFRHQLVEFGLLGSLGWLVWVGSCLRLLGRRAGDASFQPRARGIKAAIVGIGLASLLGMPSQHPALQITFWVFVFWCAARVGWPEPADHTSSRKWLLACVVALVFA